MNKLMRKAEDIGIGNWVITTDAAGGREQWRVDEIDELSVPGEIILYDEYGTGYSVKATDEIEILIPMPSNET